MAGVKASKEVFLHVWRILTEQTDEDHPLTAEAIIEQLEEIGYGCDRKAIYRHIEALEEFGIDIGKNTSAPRGYYVMSRDFELHELKLLADAVQSSRFITVKKSKQLINKLGSLASVHQAEGLRRGLYMTDDDKTDNEQIFYVLDGVYEAIRRNRRVSFKYFRYLPNGKKEYRNGGAEYVVSPYAVVWDNEKYYMHAYHSKYDTISSFRLDLMEGVKVTELEREEQKRYKSYSPIDRERASFSQFGGEHAVVVCEFDNSLAGAVFDQFGTKLKTVPVGEGKFRASLPVNLSQKFYSWLFGFGNGVKVVSPQSVIDEYKAQLGKVLSEY